LSQLSVIEKAVSDRCYQHRCSIGDLHTSPFGLYNW